MLYDVFWLRFSICLCVFDVHLLIVVVVVKYAVDHTTVERDNLYIRAGNRLMRSQVGFESKIRDFSFSRFNFQYLIALYPTYPHPSSR